MSIQHPLPPTTQNKANSQKANRPATCGLLRWVGLALLSWVSLGSATLAFGQTARFPAAPPAQGPSGVINAVATGQGNVAGEPIRRVSSETRQRPDALIEEVIEPTAQVLSLEPTRSKLIRVRFPITRIAITNPNIVEVIQYAPTEFELVGQHAGETTVTFWYNGEDGVPRVLRYVVKVGTDSREQQRADIEYHRLQDRINELFPNSRIQLIPVADKLIVRGQARDSKAATEIMAVIRGEVVNQNGNLLFGNINPVGGGQATRIPGAEDLPSARVVNLLQVPGEQQVMLKVRIAELSRSALREMGFDFEVFQPNWSLSHFISGSANLTAILDAGDVNLFLKAFASNSYGKVLAEPTLVTLSGRTATFIAGGEFAVPTAVGIQGVSAATTTFRGFGTQLAFTPTVIDKDRIRLHVAPSFSSLNQNNTVNGIPGLNTRAVATTVDLREGQWLAIAGLIQDQQEGSRLRLPFLGDISFIGAAFGNQNVKRDETELVVLVSPELVHPLETKQMPLILPGMEVTEPGDKAFYLLQHIEGHPDCHHRSTVWPIHQRALKRARHQAKRSPKYQVHQDCYVNGPQGFSE